MLRYTYRPILHFDISLIDFVTQVCLAMASLRNSSFCFAFSEKCEQSFNGLWFHPLMCAIILLHSASHSMIGWLVTSELRVRALDAVGELCNRVHNQSTSFECLLTFAIVGFSLMHCGRSLVLYNTYKVLNFFLIVFVI